MAESSSEISELIKKTESGELKWTTATAPPADWFVSLPDKRTVVATREGVLTVSIRGTATLLGNSTELAALLQEKWPLRDISVDFPIVSTEEVFRRDRDFPETL